MRNKEKLIKNLIAVGLILFACALVWLLLSGGNYKLIVRLFTQELSDEQVQDTQMDFGFRGVVTILLLSGLQVVCSVMPAEPVQMLAGVTFGFPVGLLLCTAGVVLGNSLIYLLYRTYGNRIRNYFNKNLEFDLEKMANSKRLALVVFLLYLLPAIPYGMICFFAASVGMRYRRYITLTVLGSIPSVCIGVGLGDITVSHNWMVTIGVFLFCIIALIVVTVKRGWIFAKVNAIANRPAYSAKTAVRKPNRFLFTFLYGVLRVFFFLKGVRLKKKNLCGHLPEGPAIVLCNHGSFLDFMYAAALLRKCYPNFVIARLYFYHKILGGLLKKLGGFPKSMFANDMESTKNCLQVLKNGGVLAMMPEARLSTVGCFEDIQPRTYSFLKKAGVPVYTVKLSGDFLADPKWGKGVRRGSCVEAELDLLFTAEQLTRLSPEQIGESVEKRLFYNELEWLQSRPKQRYRSRRLAEGLENILSVCPKCGAKHTIQTRKRDVFCEHCGKLTQIDDRYTFTGDFQFRDFAQWYHWQKEQLQRQIKADPQYVLKSKVTLRLPSKDGKSLTREAGNGVCRLSRQGLTYEGTLDGEPCTETFSPERVYRLLFGAGEDFEIYNGSEIWYFVPEERRSAVDWYLASMLIYDEATQTKTAAVR